MYVETAKQCSFTTIVVYLSFVDFVIVETQKKIFESIKQNVFMTAVVLLFIN